MTFWVGHICVLGCLFLSISAGAGVVATVSVLLESLKAWVQRVLDLLLLRKRNRHEKSLVTNSAKIFSSLKKKKKKKQNSADIFN